MYSGTLDTSLKSITIDGSSKVDKCVDLHLTFTKPQLLYWASKGRTDKLGAQAQCPSHIRKGVRWS
jgi:hypothetical protein